MSFVGKAISPSPINFGKKGAKVDLSGADVQMPLGCKAIVVTAPGNLKYYPIDSPTNLIEFDNCPLGFIPPHVPGVVRSTANGTTASVATVED